MQIQVRQLTPKRFILVGPKDEKKIFIIKCLLQVFSRIQIHVEEFKKEVENTTQILYTGPIRAAQEKARFPEAVIILIGSNKGLFPTCNHQVEEDNKYQCFAELASIIFREMGGRVVVADGVAGGGKGTHARLLAKRLGAVYMDSGLFYRLVAYHCEIVNGCKPEQGGFEQKLTELVSAEALPTIEEKVLRSFPVSKIVANWSKIQEVRDSMFILQMKAMYGTGCAIAVGEGRDLTTNLFRWADVKLFIDCPILLRAERQALLNGESVAENMKALQERDDADMNRPVSPLFYDKEGGVILVTTEGTKQDVSDQIFREVMHVLGVH
jgi:cytidylate kinase